MEISINNQSQPLHFRFENTRHMMGMRILGNRRAFHDLYELLLGCWDCEEDGMSRAEGCSYIGVISYFSYEVRHAFMGDRLVRLDGKRVKVWDGALFHIFEQEQERIEVGLDISWPQMLFVMAAWWECLRHQDCPVRVVSIMHRFTEGIEQLLQKRSKTQYPAVEPYVHGAVYAANPYLMHTMEHVNVDYLQRSRIGRVSLTRLADMMSCAAFGSDQYNDYMALLSRYARKLGCSIEELDEQVDDSVYDMEL